MRIFRPSGAPTWLEQVLASVERLFRDVMPAPFKLWRSATADLPTAADYTGAVAWDETSSLPTWSNGVAWVSPSLSGHVHTAAAITFSPAGGISATDVQAAIVELDTEKAAASHAHAAADISDFSEAVDDRVSSLLAGTQITRTYDDALGTLTLAIADDAVTNAKLANMVQATIKGRASAAGTGDPTDLTGAEVRTILGLATTSGVAFGSVTTTTFLRATTSLHASGYTAPASGQVASVGVVGGRGFFQAYDHTAVAYLPFDLIYMLQLGLGAAGTTHLTLDASYGNYANDAAAAVGGVPVKGIYRNGSVLMVRVA